MHLISKGVTQLFTPVCTEGNTIYVWQPVGKTLRIILGKEVCHNGEWYCKMVQ